MAVRLKIEILFQAEFPARLKFEQHTEHTESRDELGAGTSTKFTCMHLNFESKFRTSTKFKKPSTNIVAMQTSHTWFVVCLFCLFGWFTMIVQ